MYLLRFGVGTKRLKQKVASLLLVQSTEEKQNLFSAQRGECTQEILTRICQVDLRLGGTVIHHHLVAAIESEGFARQPAFLLRGEQNCGRIAQHSVFCPWPV